MSDDEIIESVLAGRTYDYEALIRKYNPFLYKIGRTYSFNHQDTEDLMQESFVNAYFNLSKFQRRSSFKTWLTRIMLNNCFQKKQKENRRHETTLEENAVSKYEEMKSFESPNSAVNKELHKVIEHAIQEIPDAYRHVFTLRELNGLSVTETAEALNISESNVKVRLNRAKAMLQSKILKTYSPEQIFEFNAIYCTAIVDRVMSRIANHSMN